MYQVELQVKKERN